MSYVVQNSSSMGRNRISLTITNTSSDKVVNKVEPDAQSFQRIIQY